MRTSAGRKGIVGREKSKFKGPEVGLCLGVGEATQPGGLRGSGVRGGQWEEAELSRPWEGLWLYSERKESHSDVLMGRF